MSSSKEKPTVVSPPDLPSYAFMFMCAMKVRARVSDTRYGGERPVLIPEERLFMLPLILILLLLAIVFGGFFVFSLKVAVVVAIVLLLVGAFGGYGYRGRRTV